MCKVSPWEDAEKRFEISGVEEEIVDWKRGCFCPRLDPLLPYHAGRLIHLEPEVGPCFRRLIQTRADIIFMFP